MAGVLRIMSLRSLTALSAAFSKYRELASVSEFSGTA
jgi:hypothetical protein